MHANSDRFLCVYDHNCIGGVTESTVRKGHFKSFIIANSRSYALEETSIGLSFFFKKHYLKNTYFAYQTTLYVSVLLPECGAHSSPTLVFAIVVPLVFSESSLPSPDITYTARRRKFVD